MNLGEALLKLRKDLSSPEPKKVRLIVSYDNPHRKPYRPRKTPAQWQDEILSVLEHPMTANELMEKLDCSRSGLRENLEEIYSRGILNRTAILCRGGRQFLYWRKAK